MKIGKNSDHRKMKLSKVLKQFCKEIFNIKLIFTSFKTENHFSNEGPNPKNSQSFLVYKFSCASCSSSYIGKTCRQYQTKIEEHIKKDKKSHIFKHLHGKMTCFDSHNLLF